MNRIIYIFATAFALIGVAEIFYFLFWGVYLFPGGSLALRPSGPPLAGS